jgi:hypothetical protein
MKTQIPITVSFEKTIVETHTLEVSVLVDLTQKNDPAKIAQDAVNAAKAELEGRSEPGVKLGGFKAILEEATPTAPTAPVAPSDAGR